METIELTAEQIAKSVSAAYDSVNLINELKKIKKPTDEEKATLERNVQHIQIMMGKVWFVEALTPEQITELQAI
jgi:hypothetical protein